jgi:hypothetical protein
LTLPLAVGSTPDGSRGSLLQGQQSADFSPHSHAALPHSYTRPPAQTNLTSKCDYRMEEAPMAYFKVLSWLVGS